MVRHVDGACAPPYCFYAPAELWRMRPGAAARTFAVATGGDPTYDRLTNAATQNVGTHEPCVPSQLAT
ncbi:MAG TPA: hypothetical protein K8V47_05990 [Candidatus Amulumruptor caecigallinarius]|uniref:Uncharacterized protein n=1 Tax=Candidatus Amulumruptor caecigallinarius TaxID=2109911 RepID=A0A921E911_9BACT|nr:hypothetical protein [Candidatus Amulumruptor caecigallinarius]